MVRDVGDVGRGTWVGTWAGTWGRGGTVSSRRMPNSSRVARPPSSSASSTTMSSPRAAASHAARPTTRRASASEPPLASALLPSCPHARLQPSPSPPPPAHLLFRSLAPPPPTAHTETLPDGRCEGCDLALRAPPLPRRLCCAAAGFRRGPLLRPGRRKHPGLRPHDPGCVVRRGTRDDRPESGAAQRARRASSRCAALKNAFLCICRVPMPFPCDRVCIFFVRHVTIIRPRQED